MNVGPHYRNSISKEILRYLVTGVAIYIVLSSPTGTRRMLKNICREWKNRRGVRDALYRLQKKKWVEFSERADGAIVATITQAGQQKIRVWDLETLVIEKPMHWDKQWHIVAFDIAERRRKAREALRGMLLQLDFYQLQRSILVHPYPCEAELELLQEVFSIPKHEVMHFLANHVPHEGYLKRKFALL